MYENLCSLRDISTVTHVRFLGCNDNHRYGTGIEFIVVLSLS